MVVSFYVLLPSIHKKVTQKNVHAIASELLCFVLFYMSLAFLSLNTEIHVFSSLHSHSLTQTLNILKFINIWWSINKQRRKKALEFARRNQRQTILFEKAKTANRTVRSDCLLKTDPHSSTSCTQLSIVDELLFLSLCEWFSVALCLFVWQVYACVIAPMCNCV